MFEKRINILESKKLVDFGHVSVKRVDLFQQNFRVDGYLEAMYFDVFVEKVQQDSSFDFITVSLFEAVKNTPHVAFNFGRNLQVFWDFLRSFFDVDFPGVKNLSADATSIFDGIFVSFEITDIFPGIG